MAAPSYATDLNDLYTDTDNFTAVNGGRVTTAETDDYIQGNNCWSHDPFSSGIEGGIYDNTTAPTITAGDAVYVWTKCDVAATLATHAAGGIQVIIGDSATVYDCFYALGSDDYQYGGWKCIPVDPTLTPSTNVGGTPTVTDHFGVRWNVPSTGASKGYPMKIDAIREGRSATVTAGDATTPATWSDLAAYDATGTRQWGICQPNAAGAEIQGVINWGTSGTACYFDDDSGETIIIIDTEWTSTDFTKIIIDHASSTFNMNGLTIKALGTNNPGQFIFNNASTTSALANNTFDSIGITTLRAGVTVTNCKWKTTDTVTQNGADFDGCVFDKGTGTASLLSDNPSNIDGCSFTSDGSNHAVQIETPGAYNFNDNNFTSYATVDGSTGNEVIYNNCTRSTADSYSESNQDQFTSLYSGSIIEAGQGFTGDGGKLSSATFYLQKSGTPTGNITAYLYAHTGTFGTSGTPTGSILATSETVDISTLTTSWALQEFQFFDNVTLTNATKYFIVLHYSGGDSSNTLRIGVDGTSPAHGGNYATYISSWTAVPINDAAFYVYTGGAVILNVSSAGTGTISVRNATGASTQVNTSVDVTVTVKDKNGNLLSDVLTSVHKTSDRTEIMNEDTVAGVASTSYTGTTPVEVEVRCRKASSADTTKYKAFSSVQTISTTGLTLAVTMIEDPNNNATT